MKEGFVQLFAVIGITGTIMGCIYGVGKFAEFLCEICTRVRLLEEDIKKLRHLVLLTKDKKEKVND